MPTGPKSSRAKAAAAKKAAEGGKQQAEAQKEGVVARTPDWPVWRTRRSATLEEALRLTLNISTTLDSVEALRLAKDPRVKKFRTHLNSLRKEALERYALGEHDPEKLKCLVPVVRGEKPGTRTQYRLMPYVEWLRTAERLPGVQPPAELFSMFPPAELVANNGSSPEAPPHQSISAAISETEGLAQPTARTTKTQPPTKVEVEAQTELARMTSKSGEHFDDSGPLPARGSMAIGLLLMYLRQLATDRQAPPRTMLQGSGKTVNVSEVCRTLDEFLSKRTDLQETSARRSAGAAFRTLRKSLGEGRRHFEDDITDD